jgi:hypothetical protein
VASHPIALGGHYVLWRSALQERVDVAERSLSAAAHKLEPLNRNRAEPEHENMGGLQKARNGMQCSVRGVMGFLPDYWLEFVEAAENPPAQPQQQASEPQTPQLQQQTSPGTGPLETGSGGAPAASPQGETPPGMQSAPTGSSAKDPKSD